MKHEPNCPAVSTEPEPLSGYDAYWNTVLGSDSDADRIVADYELAGMSERGLDEWLGNAEADARVACGLDAYPATWREHHTRALAELSAAARVAEARP